MTNEEAMKQIKVIKVFMGYDKDNPIVQKAQEALDMAIKALEQESILDKIKTDVKEWYWKADKQALAKDPCVVDAMIDLFIRTIDKYKSESEG